MRRRKQVNFRFKFTLLLICLAAGIIAMHAKYYYFSAKQSALLVLLLPDDADLADSQTRIWLDAAQEEGLIVQPMRDSEFLKPWTNRSRIAGIIIPDQVHKRASDILIGTLERYVDQGGKLMVVYDAGIWMPSNSYAENHSRFSGLAGVQYGLYDTLKAGFSNWQPVLGSTDTLTQLGVPPGKYVEYEDIQQGANKIAPDLSLYSLSGYDQALLNYDSFETRGVYSGKVLLQTPRGGIIAGRRAQGSGEVLFVNLPLGYLKGRTDGLLLHGFLHYFANAIVHVPYLLAVPEGIGGLVLNWHLDSNVSLEALNKLHSLNFYQQGPYSVHITAGPDAHEFKDGLGLNVEHNKITQQWIRFFNEKGYRVGSHGGWIHDYFGNHVTPHFNPEFEDYLRLNKLALEKFTTTPVQEYSAPEGNHPTWVTDWLAKNNIVAYYFTGNSGMGPTRSYRDGILQHDKIWSFPILIYKDMAGFEELKLYGVGAAETEQWLKQITDFSVALHAARLIYFHPRGALLYPEAMQKWLAYTAKLSDEHSYRWYTMSDLAEFLNKRTQVSWQAIDRNRQTLFTASHPHSLAKMTWCISAGKYQKPELIQGTGTVRRIKDNWLLTAGDVKELQFRADKVAE